MENYGGKLIPEIRLKDLDFELPKELISQYPCSQRDGSKLLVCERASGKVRHCRFREITEFIQKDDILIFNDTRVFPARLYGHKEDTKAGIEILLLEKKDVRTWKAILRPARRIKPGTTVRIDDEHSLVPLERLEEGNFLVRFNKDMDYPDLEKKGSIPLPPYISRPFDPALDREHYQTVYAREYGAVAAPTAGFHFTRELLDDLTKKGVSTGFVTLHISYATFAPVRSERITDHKMHSEYLFVPEETVRLINQKKSGRVIAVGTTVVRALESAAAGPKKIRAFSGYIDTFIYPGYEFKVVDSLITNFHLPGSTLLLLVAGLTGLDKLKKLYQEAIRGKYRFFSYGDAMLIL
ncbi:MAG: tRNA preQ1(34) S-adenosylmethionine ribosyltransferase-isomerase QueA [bacterium]|nr:tRNA preQ1(34) S-adenosylmethionine ribosyltransferase-isomerase QueA [bacterium]